MLICRCLSQECNKDTVFVSSKFYRKRGSKNLGIFPSNHCSENLSFQNVGSAVGGGNDGEKEESDIAKHSKADRTKCK